MKVLFINNMRKDAEVSNLVENPISFGDIVAAYDGKGLDIFYQSLANMLRIAHVSQVENPVMENSILFSYNLIDKRQGSSVGLEWLAKSCSESILSKLFTEANQILQWEQEQFDSSTWMEFFSLCCKVENNPEEMLVLNPVIEQKPQSSIEQKRIDAMFCYFGKMSWDGKEIKIAKYKPHRRLINEYWIMVDRENGKLQRCKYSMTARGNSYFKVVQTMDMDDKLCRVSRAIPNKGIDPGIFSSKSILTDSNINNSVLNMIFQHAVA